MIRCQIYITILILAVASACSDAAVGVVVESEVVQGQTDGVTEVDFRAVLDGYFSTRSGKESWEVGNEIDIATQMTTQLSSSVSLDFVTYSVTDASTGELEPSSDDALYFVEGVSNSYFAVYPEGLIEAGSNNFRVDLTDQSGGLDGLDLLYASAVVSDQQSDYNQIGLSFTHQYAIVTFKFNSAITNGTFLLRGANSKAEFDLLSGTFNDQEVADITLNYDSSTMSCSVLVLPWQNLSNIELVISLDGDKAYIFKPNIVDSDGSMVIWQANQQYEYSVTI